MVSSDASNGVRQSRTMLFNAEFSTCLDIPINIMNDSMRPVMISYIDVGSGGIRSSFGPYCKSNDTKSRLKDSRTITSIRPRPWNGLWACYLLTSGGSEFGLIFWGIILEQKYQFYANAEIINPSLLNLMRNTTHS